MINLHLSKTKYAAFSTTFVPLLLQAVVKNLLILRFGIVFSLVTSESGVSCFRFNGSLLRTTCPTYRLCYRNQKVYLKQLSERAAGGIGSIVKNEKRVVKMLPWTMHQVATNDSFMW